jgi:predicted RNA-binding Zn-ribbon protein involved in translation (DUF1610 family)
MKKKKLTVKEIEMPKTFKIIRIIWFVIVIVSIINIILYFILSSFSQRMHNDGLDYIVALILPASFPVLVVALVCIPKVFEPEFEEIKLKKELYTQNKTKELKEKIFSEDADIQHRSIKKRVKSISEGLRPKNCPKCGDSVEADEEYCNNCGAHLIKKCHKCKTIGDTEDLFCRNCGTRLDD